MFDVLLIQDTKLLVPTILESILSLENSYTLAKPGQKQWGGCTRIFVVAVF
jgi:hypothetical protein